MSGIRVSLLVGVAVAGTLALTVTARGAGAGLTSPPRDVVAGLTSSVSQNGVVVEATAGAARVPVGGLVTVAVTVSSDQGRTVVVGLQAFDPTGRSVLARAWTGQELLAGRTATWTVRYRAAAAPVGRYRIAVAVYTRGGRSLLAWNPDAADVIVAVPAAPAPVAAGHPAAIPLVRVAPAVPRRPSVPRRTGGPVARQARVSVAARTAAS